MATQIVPLHLHTEFSLMNSLIKISELSNKLIQYRYPACAITDHNTLAGIIPFSLALQEKSIIPIIGIEVDVLSQEQKFHLTLLAYTKEGYQNLLQINQVLNQGKMITKDFLYQKKEGLILLSGCPKSEVIFYANQEDKNQVVSLLKEYKEAFKENFYVEIQRKTKAEQLILEIADFLKIKAVATLNCHFFEKEDEIAYKILSFIQNRKKLSFKDLKGLKSQENNDVVKYLPLPEEFVNHFSGWEELCFETLNLFDKIKFTFSYGLHIDKISLPKVYTNSEQKLRELIFQKLKQKIGTTLNQEEQKRYFERLEKEFEVIKQKGLCDYFLMVYDFINYAKNHQIPIGFGRGSAVSSLSAYVLDITQIDPLKYDLIFERFLSLSRKDPPDIDLDFPPEGRDALINYAFEKYGSEFTGRLITVNRFSYQVVSEEIEKVVGNFLTFEEKKKIVKKLNGLPRNFSQHPSGIIIADKKINDIFPIIKSFNNRSLIQLQVEDLAKLRIIKFDFLGLKILSIVNDTLKLLQEKENLFLELQKVNLEDENIYKMLSNGDTLGVFQVEGEGFTKFLQELSPKCFNDLILALALYRPATLRSSLCSEFLHKRREKQEKIKKNNQVSRLDNFLEELFNNTYGIPIFQEDIILMLMKLANYSAEEAEYFRRIFSHGKDKKEIWILKNDLRKRMQNRKWTKSEINKISTIIEKFAEYGFNKAHAVAYAYLSYLTAYLKFYFPTYYFCAYLNHNKEDKEKIAIIIQYLLSKGIKILFPDINKSDISFTIETTDSIRIGLRNVKGVKKEFADRIISERKKGKFKDFYDFCKRLQNEIKANKEAVENLIKAGAYDSITQEGRKKLLYEVLFFTSFTPSGKYQGIKKNIPDFSESEKEMYEKESIGFCVRKI